MLDALLGIPPTSCDVLDPYGIGALGVVGAGHNFLDVGQLMWEDQRPAIKYPHLANQVGQTSEDEFETQETVVNFWIESHQVLTEDFLRIYLQTKEIG